MPLKFFGNKPEINVTMTYDVMVKCRCMTCQVQTDSPCIQPKIAAKKEMLQNPDLSKMIGPGMTKNLEMLKGMNLESIRGMSMEDMKKMSDQMMKNTPQEEIDSMGPKADDMPGPYCANGATACNDLDYNKACLCSECEVFKDFNLSNGNPKLYYCRDGKAR